MLTDFQEDEAKKFFWKIKLKMAKLKKNEIFHSTFLIFFHQNFRNWSIDAKGINMAQPIWFQTVQHKLKKGLKTIFCVLALF